MEFIIDYWVIALIVVLALVYKIAVFMKSPSQNQLAQVREWLLYAVAQAEKKLGSGTGQLKLRYVYDLFILRFGTLARMISFETFSMLVDEALYIFRDMLRDNEAVSKYVGASPEAAEKLELGIDLDDEEGDETHNG